MKNRILFTILSVLMISVLSVAAYASAAVEYSLEEVAYVDSDETGLAIVARGTLVDEMDFVSYKDAVVLDTSVLVPVDAYTGDPIEDLEAEPDYPFDPGVFKARKNTALSYTPTAPAWTVDGNTAKYDMELYWGDFEKYPINTFEDAVIYTLYVKYADGKSFDDVTADTFKVEYIKLADSDVSHYFGSTEYANDIEVTTFVPAPVVEETYWNVGNGYNLVDMNSNVVANNSAVTKSNETETEVTVKYGGYYQGTDNWSGAALKEAVTVDGLEIEVTYTTLPSSSDCWAYIGVLADPSIFSTKSDAYNNGYVNLIRYAADSIAVYDTDSWTTVGNYGTGEGFFAIEAGDVLRVCFDKNAEGTYDITYVKNGAETFKLPVALDLEEALGGTAGYPVVSASCKGSEAGAFEYTVDVAPEELAVAKIPVAAGDTVYEYTENVSYKATEIAENGTYDVLATGLAYVVVNSGYTAQKVYMVSPDVEGYYAEFAPAANGVLGDDEVSVRVVDPQGIRFFGTISNDYVLERNGEYGFIMTAESAYNNLPEDYVLDMALVEAGKAKKGVAHDGNGTDKYFKRDAEATIIAGVLYGIPKTAEGVQTVIVSRPYYKVAPDVYFYGEETKATLYDIAKAIYNKAGYEVAWEYAKEVIELVEGDIDEPEVPEIDNEIAIDVSELYK